MKEVVVLFAFVCAFVAAKTIHVPSDGLGAWPVYVRIDVGDCIRWKNQAMVTTGVREATGLFSSPMLPHAGSFRYCFETEGVFTYANQLHADQPSSDIVVGDIEYSPPDRPYVHPKPEIPEVESPNQFKTTSADSATKEQEEANAAVPEDVTVRCDSLSVEPAPLTVDSFHRVTVRGQFSGEGSVDATASIVLADDRQGTRVTAPAVTAMGGASALFGPFDVRSLPTGLLLVQIQVPGHVEQRACSLTVDKPAEESASPADLGFPAIVHEAMDLGSLSAGGVIV